MSDRNGCTCATRDPWATEHRELCPLRNPPVVHCRQCKAPVEPGREAYATPVCFACLPPPKPLNTAWSLPAEWLADMAEALEHVRHGAPKKLTPDLLIELVGVLREDRDDWKLRAERAEHALPSTPGAKRPLP